MFLLRAFVPFCLLFSDRRTREPTVQPIIARMATSHPSGEKRLIGPLGALSKEEATAAVAKAASTRCAPREEAASLLERTGLCPLAVGVVGSTLKQVVVL